MSTTLLEREVLHLRASLARSEQRVVVLEQALAVAGKDKALLERALKEALRQRTGLDLDAPGQLRLLFGEAAGAQEPTPAHADEAPDGETPDDRIRQRHRPRRAARQLDWSALAREQVTHELPPEERLDPVTGLALVEVGESLFEELDYKAARLSVLVHHRKVYGLSPQDAAVHTVAPLTAPLPSRPIEKSPASAALLAWLLVQKYRHHLPLYRQEAIFAREGLAIPRQTSCDWVACCAALLAPIQAALRRRILKSGVVQLDVTPVMCQQGRGHNNHQAYLWVLLSPLVDGVVYDFTPGRGYDEVKPVLGDVQGVLVGNGYAVRKKLAGDSGGRLVTAGCWSHALRKSRDALLEAPRTAAEMVVAIGARFAVERDADQQDLDAAQRQVLREARCPTLLAQIEEQRRALEGTTSAAGKLAEATTCLANQWDSLGRFVHDGRFPIHNNACERAIRPLAVGRRNWLFAGSERGGQTAATIYTLSESCRAAGIDTHVSLADVLVRVNTHPARRIDELLPAHWKQRFGTPPAS